MTVPKSLTIDVAHDLGDAGLGIDLDLGDVAAVGIGRGRALEDGAHVERSRHAFGQLLAGGAGARPAP